MSTNKKEPSHTTINKFEIVESMGTTEPHSVWNCDGRYKISSRRLIQGDGTHIQIDLTTYNEEIIKKVNELYDLIKKQNT